MSSSKSFHWKASVLRGLEWLKTTDLGGHPLTVVVPALYSAMPAEGIALGWFNEIDALHTIRDRIKGCGNLTGWDVFTFHTQHNLDPFFDSTIAAVRQTWLHEGSLHADAVVETVRRYGRPYDYHRLEARLVENLVFQSAIMDWLTVHASQAPFRFHVIGTAVLSALVWAGAMPFNVAVRTAGKIGSGWDASLYDLAVEDLKGNKNTQSDDDLGWQRFYRVRQLIEGQATLSLAIPPDCMPDLDAPSRPFWFSATASEEPVLIATRADVQAALESVNLASWAPEDPRPLANDRVRGWLISAMHPMASACRGSVYNYLLATPAASLLFLAHIAVLGGKPAQARRRNLFERLRLSKPKITGL